MSSRKEGSVAEGKKVRRRMTSKAPARSWIYPSRAKTLSGWYEGGKVSYRASNDWRKVPLSSRTSST